MIELHFRFLITFCSALDYSSDFVIHSSELEFGRN